MEKLAGKRGKDRDINIGETRGLLEFVEVISHDLAPRIIQEKTSRRRSQRTQPFS